MLEMHKLTRYEYAPVLKFGSGFDAEYDAGTRRMAAGIYT